MIQMTQGCRWKSTTSFWVVLVLVTCGTRSFRPPCPCPRAATTTSSSTSGQGGVSLLGGITFVSASIQTRASSPPKGRASSASRLHDVQPGGSQDDPTEPQTCAKGPPLAKNDETVIPGTKSSGSAYHLLWSPGFLRKTLITTPALVLASLLWRTTSSSATLASLPCHSVPLFHNWVVPLLASSCCLLQLALNVLSVGCAGFNTYLGPVRPYFFSVFVVLQMDAALRTWSTAIQRQSSAVKILRRVAWSLAQVGVALLPEAIDVYNRWRFNKRTEQVNDATMTLKARIRLEVPTMGCVACINTIDAALNRQGISQRARVLKASSSLHPLGMKGGSVAIEAVAESDAALTELVSNLIGATDSVGFAGAVVASIDKQDINTNGATGEL